MNINLESYLDYLSDSYRYTQESVTLKLDENPHFDIKRILDEEMRHIKIDSRLCRAIGSYVNRFVNKDEEHVNFFGGNLTGVNRIIFDTEDRNEWCIDILDIDESSIKSKVRQLDHIGSEWVRGTDAMNLSIIYLVHKLHKSTTLSKKDKEKAIVDCLFILQCKFLSSLLYGYFKHPVSESLAIAVYDSLNRKFYIKKYGTWGDVLENRSKDIYFKEDTHRQVIDTLEPDARIQYMITDIQTRIKALILKIYEVTMNLRDKGVGVSSTNTLIDAEGTLEVKDIERDLDKYVLYIHETMQDRRAFIKMEIVEVLSDSITTMPPKLLVDVLNVLVDKAEKNDKELVEASREAIMYMFEYFRTNKRAIKDLSNLGQLILNLKSLVTASKTSNETIIHLREYFEKVTKKNIKSANPATVAGVRTGLILYIMLRALTKNHYQT